MDPLSFSAYWLHLPSTICSKLVTYHCTQVMHKTQSLFQFFAGVAFTEHIYDSIVVLISTHRAQNPYSLSALVVVAFLEHILSEHARPTRSQLILLPLVRTVTMMHSDCKYYIKKRGRGS